MQLQWTQATSTGAVDPVTDYRLRQSTAQKGATAQDVWWSALIQMEGATVTALETALQASFPGQFVIPQDHLEDDGRPDHIFTLYARQNVLQALNDSANTYHVKTVDLGAAVPQSTVDAARALPDDTETAETTEDAAAANSRNVVYPQGTVTMAVIDDGIAFAHNLFRKGLTDTRLEGMFIMDAPKPNGSGVGRKFNQRQINKMLAAYTNDELLDEPGFYAAAGSTDYGSQYFSTTVFRRSHGTHVMSLAAGYPMDETVQNRPIIAVQLPSKVTEDTSGSNLAPALITAIRYIKRKAARIRIGSTNGPIAPLVVNFSYGNFSGPHDGTGLIARILDRELASTPEQEIRVILPAGNSNIARVHAAVNFANAGNASAISLDLNVPPDDMSSNYVQMWMPYAADTPPPDFVHVRVTPPHGPQSMTVQAQAGSRQELHDDHGNVVAELGYNFEPAPTARGVITLAVNPTATHDTNVDIAPSGRWKIEIMKHAISDSQQVEVRIKRDERLPGYPTGARQAYFDNACYVLFDAYGYPLAVDPMGDDCPVKRAGTLSGFACGAVPIVVGGLVERTGQMAFYSSAGPISLPRDLPTPTRDGPDASARSDDSLIVQGVLGAGSRSGSMVRMSGTSVAAPLVARQVAQALEDGAAGDRAWVAAQAQASDAHYPPLAPPQPFETRTGGGRWQLPYPFPPGAAEA